MRRCYLVCYDVRDPKRLRRAHKVMKAYGEPWQYSVFYCTLKPIDRVRLENALRDVVNLKQDQGKRSTNHILNPPPAICEDSAGGAVCPSVRVIGAKCWASVSRAA